MCLFLRVATAFIPSIVLPAVLFAIIYTSIVIDSRETTVAEDVVDDLVKLVVC